MGLNDWMGAFGRARTLDLSHDLERGYESALLIQSIELEHYNPPKRGAVENPTWRLVRSVRSLHADVEARYVSKRDVGVDGAMVEIEFIARRPGPFEGLLEIETATGKGTVPFAFFAVK